ncbi:hypothetical protein XENORESO_016361 [Xenotaenia resolanae]|uniref:Uncharacterized protein n=1 Tax=Xenotaenia resolanae TaxID=208358 RepID=A0ABV0WTZ0_9TELE
MRQQQHSLVMTTDVRGDVGRSMKCRERLHCLSCQRHPLNRGAYRYEADRTYCCVEEQGIDNNGTRFKRPTARCGVVVRVQIPRFKSSRAYPELERFSRAGYPVRSTSLIGQEMKDGVKGTCRFTT